MSVSTIHSPHATSLRHLVASLVRNWPLIVQLARRDILGRYRGSALGVFWSFINPVLMLAVYTLVFSVVFRNRWPGSSSDRPLEFAIVLFAGLIVFGVFGECMQRAPGLIVSQPNFVKKVVFPLEIMPAVVLVAALFHAAISFLVLLVLIGVSHGALEWTAVLEPLILFPLACLCMGLAWFFAALGVYVRDIGQVISVALSALMFLSPLFFPSSALPAALRWMTLVNPLAFPIESSRDLLVFGRMPDFGHLAAYTATCLVVLWGGFAWFQKSRNGFADVI
jgi:lipopolysaccharide transport system permease protein